jgi:hypothetical protein
MNSGARGSSMSSADYLELLAVRQQWISGVARRLSVDSRSTS